LPPQPVDATHALNLSAGVSNSKVLREFYDTRAEGIQATMLAVMIRTITIPTNTSTLSPSFFSVALSS